MSRLALFLVVLVAFAAPEARAQSDSMFLTPPLDSLIFDTRHLVETRLSAAPEAEREAVLEILDVVGTRHQSGEPLGVGFPGDTGWQTSRFIEEQTEIGEALWMLLSWLQPGPVIHTFGPKDPASREMFVREFLTRLGVTGEAADHVIARTDLEQDVWRVSIPPAYEVVQWHAAGVQEISFGDPGWTASDMALPDYALGRDGQRVRRIQTTYRPTRPVDALLIRARETMDDWTIPGIPYLSEGGGNVYITSPGTMEAFHAADSHPE